MGDQRDVRKIAAIYWPDNATESGRQLEACEHVGLKMVNVFHGDHDEDWIVQYDVLSGRELSRHNPRYVESIAWEGSMDVTHHHD